MNAPSRTSTFALAMMGAVVCGCLQTVEMKPPDAGQPGDAGGSDAGKDGGGGAPDGGDAGSLDPCGGTSCDGCCSDYYGCLPVVSEHWSACGLNGAKCAWCGMFGACFAGVCGEYFDGGLGASDAGEPPCTPGPRSDGGADALFWTTTDGVTTSVGLDDKPTAILLSASVFGVSIAARAVPGNLPPTVAFYSRDGGRTPEAFGCYAIWQNFGGSITTFTPPGCHVVLTSVGCQPGDIWEGRFWVDSDGGVDHRAIWDGGFRVK